MNYTKYINVMNKYRDPIDVYPLAETDPIRLEKPTFGSYELMNTIEDFLRDDINTDTIEFVGLCTDICVVSNVLMAKARFYNDCEIAVDSSCCAGVTPESHEAALQTMRMCQINVY